MTGPPFEGEASVFEPSVQPEGAEALSGGGYSPETFGSGLSNTRVNPDKVGMRSRLDRTDAAVGPRTSGLKVQR
jgi:hypothetical protein